MVAENNVKVEDVEQPFRIENNVLKGKVVPNMSPYTNVGKLLFDKLKNNPRVVGQVDVVTGIEDTFETILDRSIKCALWLEKQGIGFGDVVAIASHNQRDSFIPCIAAALIGAICNPWDYNINTQLARHYLTLTEPKVIFVNEQVASVISEAIKIETYQTKMIVFGDYPGVTSFADMLKGHSKSAVANFQCKEHHEIALILFTSGTTGLPKGVQLSHRAILNVLELDNKLELQETTPAWFTGLYWISGILLSLKNITSCTKRVITPPFDEKSACEIIEKYKVTWVMLGTSMANRFVRYDRFHEYDFSALKRLFTGGASLMKESQDLMKKCLPNTEIIQAYGMTELGGLAASQSENSQSGSCGTVADNCEIKIIDPATGKVLGPNQNGELCAKTKSIMSGYYRNPEATKNVIDEDGWLHTGDLAFYDQNGEIFIVDRLKELIKYRGYHITPNQIENLLQSHPSVLEAAVVSVPHPTDGEHPIAFICTVPNKTVSAEELHNLVANNLMDYCKLRAGVKFLPSLPHTASGKIAKKELKMMAKELVVY